MNAKQLGHRAAAWGTPRDEIMGVSPLPTSVKEMYEAYDEVEKQRAAGLDPNGHPPCIPNLCDRDVSKVCNCCAGCRTVCWAEGFEGATERAKTRLGGLFRKLLPKAFKI